VIRFILQRLLQAVVVLFCVITLVFFLVRLMPGNPFAKEKVASPHILEQLKASYGEDTGLLKQYGNYLGGLVHGDMRWSYKFEGWRVNELIFQALPISLSIGLLALGIALALGIPSGIIAAARKNSMADYGAMSLSMLGICMPTFVMGPLLALIFAFGLRWFSVAGWYEASDIVLPALTLGLYYAAYIARMSRGGMLEILSQDFIRTARAKGASEARTLLRHALKGGLRPVVAFIGPAAAGLVTGSFIVENIFQIPGLGQHFVSSITNRDYYLLLGAVIVYTSLVVLLNLLSDIAQAFLDPRVRLHD
jgi:oligopeptide transport system permease protein